MQWTRTKQWVAVGILVVTAAMIVVTAGAAGVRGPVMLDFTCSEDIQAP